MKATRLYFLLALLLMAGGVMMQAQNAPKHPSVIAKDEGFGYRGLKKLISMDSVYAGTYFEDAENKECPPMFIKADWNDIKEFISQKVREIDWEKFE